MKLTVSNRVRIDGTPKELAAIEEPLRREFTHRNPDHYKHKALGLRGKPPPRELVTFELHGGPALSVPRGGFARARAIIDAAGFSDVAIESYVVDGDDTIGEIPRHAVDLWSFQQHVQHEALIRQKGLIRSPAGSGKSTLLLSLIAEVNRPALVVVSDLKLVTQWVERTARELGVSKSWVGVIQGKTRRIAPVTIAMIQTLQNCVDDYTHAFGLVAVDEVHRAAATTVYRVIDRFHSRYRIGVSDDERRSDKKEFLIYDLFGPVIAEVDYDELVAAGVVLDVEFVVVPSEFDIDWYHLLEPAEQALAKQKVLDAMADDDDRNRLIAETAYSYCVDEGEQVLVMTHRREHVGLIDRALGEMRVKSGVIMGGQEDKRSSDETVQRVRDGSLQAAVATYQAAGTGVDLPMMARGVFATPIANSRDGRSPFKQYRGRYARRGKTRSEVTYVWDVKLFGTKPLENLCRWSSKVRVMWNGKLRPGKEVLKEIQHANEVTSNRDGFYPDAAD